MATEPTAVLLIPGFFGYAAFGAELLALFGLLVRIGSPVPVLFLVLAGMLDFARWWRKGSVPAVLIANKPSDRLALLEYYGLFFPVGILAAAALRSSADSLLIVAHLMLFPVCASLPFREAISLVFTDARQPWWLIRAATLRRRLWSRSAR